MTKPKPNRTPAISPLPNDDPRSCGSCRFCGDPMVSQDVYTAEWRTKGYLRHMAHGLCSRDYTRAYRARRLPRTVAA